MTNALLRKGKLLAAFLNESEEMPEQKQVLQLVQMCQKLCSTLPTVAPTEWRLGGHQLLDLTKNRAARALLGKINRHLDKLTFRRSLGPQMLFISEAPASIPVLTRCISPADKILGKYASSSERLLNRAGVYDIVLDLLEAGMLLHVRRCPGCRRWLMAEKSHKIWCGGTCRTKPYRKEHKREWKQYMRDYRLGNLGTKSDRDKNRPKLLRQYRGAQESRKIARRHSLSKSKAR